MMIESVHPTFPARAFARDALTGYDDLELTPRARQIAHELHRHLPPSYPDAIAILLASLGDESHGPLEGMASFVYLPHVFFVAEYGLDDWEESLQAQYELTKRFTAEFSIRPFLVHHRDATLARLREWTADPNLHVRRLVSEGTRPRLPWAPVLREFVADPQPVLALLELLKDDPESYVRRSVANNLNDISKDHPDLVVDVCHRWLRNASPERAWVVRHALRTLVKRAHPGALATLGFGDPAAVSISAVRIEPATPRIGETLRITFSLTNDAAVAADLLADLKVHFVKANGSTTPKVFKLVTATLAPGESRLIRKSIALNQQTTRTHYPGQHTVEIVVNGATMPLGCFQLLP